MKGIVVKVFGRYYTVLAEGYRGNCVLRGKLKLDDMNKRFSDPVAVGDIVDFEISSGDEGVIRSVEKRKNVFSRKDRGSSKEDVIAANIDQVVIIQSFASPRMNLRFVDRLLVRAEKENVPAVLCVNKSDLSGPEMRDYVLKYYKGSKCRFFFTCASDGSGMDEFKSVIESKLSLFMGSSGVGKSSILNALFPGLCLRTSEISTSTGKGRHTTTNVEMIEVSAGTKIIDTPGVREFGLVDIEPEQLSGFFMEFGRHSEKCGFRPCSHDHEPKCAVKNLVERGKIHEDRYVSYLNILASLREYQEYRYKTR